MFFLPPVVLRVLPLRGSSAPVGFIYDATPDPVDGDLLATASAFFFHQGHQVFHDPCPDLAAYCRSMGVPPSTVVPVNCLPDYLRNSGLEILAGLAAPSLTDTNFAGTAFMAAYLSPSPSGPPLAGESEGASSVGSSLVGPPTSSTSQFVGGNPAASARTTVSLPASSLGGAGVLEGPPLSGSGVPCSGGSSPPRRSSGHSDSASDKCGAS